MVKNIIDKCEAVFGNQYDYSQIKIGFAEKQTIKCNLCQTIFKQHINEHLNMSCCNGCEKLKVNKFSYSLQIEKLTMLIFFEI
jgi:hypothetical protein